jgi:SAM-dependent methyltransferases
MSGLPTQPVLPPIAGQGKLHAPATLRNRGPIRSVLEEVLPPEGEVLEIGAGTGEHAVYFATALPGLRWLATDPNAESLASIAAYAAGAGLPNLPRPLRLDVRSRPWPGVGEASVDAVVAINVIHIAPWETCLGLIHGAARVLKPEGALILYGPFKQDGRHTAASNALFDLQLQDMNPAYGVRDLGEVSSVAADVGLSMERQVAMPANNLTIVFRKAFSDGDRPHAANDRHA